MSQDKDSIFPVWFWLCQVRVCVVCPDAYRKSVFTERRCTPVGNSPHARPHLLRSNKVPPPRFGSDDGSLPIHPRNATKAAEADPSPACCAKPHGRTDAAVRNHNGSTALCHTKPLHVPLSEEAIGRGAGSPYTAYDPAVVYGRHCRLRVHRLNGTRTHMAPPHRQCLGSRRFSATAVPFGLCRGIQRRHCGIAAGCLYPDRPLSYLHRTVQKRRSGIVRKEVIRNFQFVIPNS